MKKRKPLMKLMTFMLAVVMMMGMSMTVYATESETDSGNTEAVCEFATAEECTKDDCPVHKTDENVESQTETADKDKTKTADKDKTETADKDKAESKDTVSGNETESDKDKDSEARKDMDKGDASGEGMTNNTIKNADQAVKTGEVNIIPVIVALAVIAAGAGGAYIIYRKKK